MMRLLHTADWHLGQEWSGVERDSDMEQHILPEIMGIVLREKIDWLLIAGDLFDDPGGRKASLRLCARLLREPFKELLSAGVNIAVIPGNHDNRPLFRLLEATLEIATGSYKGQLIVFTEPKIVQVDGLQLVGFPYLKAVQFNRLLGELPVAVEMRNQAVSNQYAHYLHLLKQHVRKDKAAVLLGHFSVSGAMLQADSDWAGSEVSYARDLTVSREALLTNDQVPQYNALGHIHLAQAVPECVVPTHYAGAPDYFARGQAKYEPQVLLVDVPEKGRVKVEPILLQNTTPFIAETVNSLTELETIAKGYPNSSLRQRVLGDLTIQVDDVGQYGVLRDRAAELFPRLQQANSIHLKSSNTDIVRQFETTDEYAQLINPRRTFAAYFEQNYEAEQIRPLQQALDLILQELTGAN